MQISLWNLDGAQNELLLPLRPSVGGETQAEQNVPSPRPDPAPGARGSGSQGREKHPLVWKTSPGSLPANRHGQSRLTIRLKMPGHLMSFSNKTRSRERLFTRAWNDSTRGLKLTELLGWVLGEIPACEVGRP